MTIDWSTLFAAIAVLVSVGGFVRGWRRDQPDIAREYQDMATKAAERIKQLQMCVEELETKIDELEAKLKARDLQLSEFQDALKKRDLIISEWQVGISKLINQLVEDEKEPNWRPRSEEKKA